MIHASASARGLGFARAWIFSLWAVYVFLDAPEGLASLPRALYAPPGVLRALPASFWDLLLTVPGLLTLKWVLLAGLLACAAGLRPWRGIAIPTALLLILQQGLARGFFYVNHQELPALFAVCVLALFPPTAFSLMRSGEEETESSQARNRLVLLLLTSLLLVPYCLIGAHRLAHNDLSFWASGALPFWVAENSYGPTWFALTPIAEAVLSQPLLVRLLELGFLVVTAAEVLAPLCLVSTRFRRVWLVVMVWFYLSTMVLMDILFWESLLLFPVLLLDREPLLRWLDRLRGQAPEQSAPPAETSQQDASLRF